MRFVDGLMLLTNCPREISFMIAQMLGCIIYVSNNNGFRQWGEPTPLAVHVGAVHF